MYSLKVCLKKELEENLKIELREKINPKNKVYSKSRKTVTRKNSFSSSIYSSFIIFAGFISLSLTIFFLIRQLQPVIKNERLKYLCTYQLGNKKSQSYKDAKLELEKLIGVSNKDTNKYCKNFLIPKEKKDLDFFHY